MIQSLGNLFSSAGGHNFCHTREYYKWYSPSKIRALCIDSAHPWLLRPTSCLHSLWTTQAGIRSFRYVRERRCLAYPRLVTHDWTCWKCICFSPCTIPNGSAHFIKLIVHSCPKEFTMPPFSYHGPLRRVCYLAAAWGSDCY